MSATIDNRVLEMRFDNKQFESGVATSMSTLDKLKQKLNLSGASKGLENINHAAKNVNMSGLANGVDTVRARFSALQVMGVTALANITNSAVNAGKRMVSALTITPIKEGLSEYENQINSVQTIMANTGDNVKTVNAALDKLNEYADLTIYNFAEMTKNAGTFTAALGKGSLEQTMTSLKGIGNWAAYAGASASDMSRATFQLGQALASGSVRLQDWMSIEHTSGMAGQNFQNAFKETAKSIGVDVDSLIEKNGSFRESLREGWLTTEVFMKTMEKFANDETMTDAATKVKTFSQLTDTLKEALGTGWATTWRLIIGDFEEAKSLWTGVNDVLSGFINRTADARNKLLESALGKGFTDLGDKINKILDPAKKAADSVKEIGDTVGKATGKLNDLGSAVDDVLGGKLGNGQERFDKLTKSGYNWMEVQNEVNKSLGNSFRYTKEQIAAQDKLLGSQKKTTESTKKSKEETTKLADAQKKQLIELSKLSDEQLKAKGYTDDQISSLRELQFVAEKLGVPFDDFINKLDEINGRWLLIDSFKNIGKSLIQVFGALHSAYRSIFEPMKPEQLFNMIGAFHKFTSSLLMNADTVKNLRLTFKGLFAALDIVTTIVGGGAKLAFKALSSILGAFDLDILSVTASIGRAIVKFRNWLFEQNAVAKAVNGLIDQLPGAINKLKDWFNTFKETPAVEAFVTAIEAIREAFDKLTSGKIDISKFAKSLGTNLANALMSIPSIMAQIGRDVIAGFQNGISAGISSGIIGKIVSFCTEFIAAFAAALGVQSPSWKTYDIAVDTVQGFINGIKDMAGRALEAVKELGTKIIEFFKNLEWDKIFAAGLSLVLVWFVKKIADAVDSIAGIFDGLGDIFSGAGKVLKSFSKVLNGIAWDLKAKAMHKIAISLGILVIALIALSRIPWPDLGKALGVLGLLSGILIGLAFALDKMDGASAKFGKGEAKFEGLKMGLIQIGAALFLMAEAVKIIGEMDIEQAAQGFAGLTALVFEMLGFLSICRGLAENGSLKYVNRVGSMMLKLSFALLVMVGVCKLAGSLSAEEMLKGAAFAGAFAIFVRLITSVAKDSGKNVSKVGGMVLKLAIAMGIMVGVCKLAGMLSAEEMLKGAAFAGAFVIFVRLLVRATTIESTQKLARIGGMMLAISTSLLMMVGVCKLVSMLSAEEMLKGAAFVGAFLIMVRALMKITTIGSEQQMAKVAGTILAMSVAIAILAGVAIILSLIDLAGLAKGIVAVGLLGGVMTAMILATRGASDVKGNLIAMSVAIAVMAAAVVALSFIDGSKLAGATAALSIIMGMFALIAKSSGTMGKVMGPLITMTIAVAMLAGILYLLSSLEIGPTLEIAASLSLLMMTLAVSMRMISKTGGLALSAIAPMAAMVLILGGIAVILGLLSKYDINPSIETAASLSILLLALVGATAALCAIGKIASGALAGVAAFAVVVAGIGAIIVALGALVDEFPDLEKFLDEGIPIMQKIGEGIGSFVGGIVGGFGEAASDALPEIGQNIADFMDKLATASENAKGIEPGSFDGVIELIGAMAGIGLTTMGTSIADIFTLGGTSMEKFQTDGVAFFDAMRAISEASSGITFDGASVDAVVEVATKLAELQSSLEPIGGVISWFSGRDDLATFGINIGVFINAMKFALSSLDGVTLNEEALSSIISASTRLATLQTSLEPIGGVISWFKGRDDLATFGVNIGLFINSMKNALSNLDGVTLNEEALSSIISAATSLAALQSVLEPIGGVISWFSGRDDLATFGYNVGLFVGSMKNALSTLDGTTLDEEALTSVLTAAIALSELQSSLEPMGGVIDWFTGRDDLGTFGTNIGLFADAMAKLKTGMGEDGITEAAVTSITNAGEALIALQKALPEEGWFDGKMNLTEFSQYVTDFATAMSDFGAKTAGIDSTAVSTAVNTAFRIKYLIESLAGIDTSGIAAFTGVGTGGFGADGAAYKIAQAISSYSTEVANIDTAAVSTSVSAAMTLKNLIVGLVGLDTSGIENFKIESIGSSMQSYASSVAGLDANAVSASVTAADRLKTLIAGLAGLDSSGISNFRITSIGSSLKSYSSSVSGFDSASVYSSVNAADKLKKFISSLSGLDTSGVSSFKSAVAELGTVSISKVVETFSGATDTLSNIGGNLIDALSKGMTSKKGTVTTTASTILSDMKKKITDKYSDFQSTGSNLMAKFVTGITKQKARAASAVTAVVSPLARKIRSFYGSFHSAGVYLGTGLIQGINSKKAAAYAAGYALGQAAVRGEKAGQQSKSPSKLTIKAGKWLGEGLVIGINKMSSKVYTAGYNLGDQAAASLSSAITRVSDVIDSGMNYDPTIRPVLDLSEVQAGAGTISGLLGNSTVGLSANIDAINAARIRNSQNGSIEDVISAIDKLRKDLGNVGGTTYSINGITYDDGSNINDAVRTLVRAAKIERRV